MEFNLIKIKGLIAQSNLSKKDKNDFLTILAKAKDEELKNIVDLFEKDLWNIEIINNVYKAKKEAICNKDTKMWENILTEEAKSLDTIENI